MENCYRLVNRVRNDEKIMFKIIANEKKQIARNVRFNYCKYIVVNDIIYIAH